MATTNSKVAPMPSTYIRKVPLVQVCEASCGATSCLDQTHTVCRQQEKDPTSQPAHTRKPPPPPHQPLIQPFRIVLAKRWFLACWWLVFLCRLCSIAFLTSLAQFYYWILHTHEVHGMLADLKFDISLQALNHMTLGFVAIDLVELALVLRSVGRSWRSRELTFAKDNLARVNGRSSVSAVDVTSARKSMMIRQSMVSNGSGDRSFQAYENQTMLGLLMQLVHKVQRKCIEPLFSIRGEYFEDYFLASEIFEVVAQVYQAYRMSMFIPARWINHLFVGMIVVNCWSTPVILWLVPASKKPLRRFLSLVFSSFLNFVDSVVIPLVIFLPYVKAYDSRIKWFPEEFVMDDVWFAKIVSENQQLFVTSYLDFVTTCFPHWSLCNCLMTCEDLCRRQRRARPANASVVSIRVGPSQPLGSSSVRATPGLPSNPVANNIPKRHIVRHLLSIAGVIVLGFHIHAQQAQGMPGCRLDTTPWFSSKSSCVVMNINCYRRGIEGNVTQIGSILAQLNHRTMFQLIFTHCPRLQIPSNVQTLTNLAAFDIYNCTIDEWTLEASLNARDHPYVYYVDVVRSNFSDSSLPHGLMDQEIPVNFEAAYFYETNLAILPERLYQSWRHFVTMSFEFCQIQEIPWFVFEMDLQWFVFTGNPLDRINSNVFRPNNQLIQFALSSTLLVDLPNETMILNPDLTDLTSLELEYTQLNRVPKYVRDWFLTHTREGNLEVSHSLYGSPYCDLDVVHLRDVDSDEQEYHALVCAEDQGFSAGSFLMDLIEPQRQP